MSSTSWHDGEMHLSAANAMLRIERSFSPFPVSEISISNLTNTKMPQIYPRFYYHHTRISHTFSSAPAIVPVQSINSDIDNRTIPTFHASMPSTLLNPRCDLQYRAPLALAGCDGIERRTVGASPACCFVGEVIWLSLR